MPRLSKTWTSSFAVFERITFIAIVLGIIAIGGFLLLVIRQSRVEDQKAIYSNVQNVPVNTYSLGGTVKNILLPIIEFEVGQVVTSKQGNIVSYKKYTLKIGDNTQILVREATGKYRPGLISEIAVNKSITVYSTENPYQNASFTATKIEIN